MSAQHRILAILYDFGHRCIGAFHAIGWSRSPVSPRGRMSTGRKLKRPPKPPVKMSGNIAMILPRSLSRCPEILGSTHDDFIPHDRTTAYQKRCRLWAEAAPREKRIYLSRQLCRLVRRSRCPHFMARMNFNAWSRWVKRAIWRRGRLS